MRIGINLLYLLPGVVGGTETYAAGLLDGLSQVTRDDEFLIFMNRESEEWPLPQAPNFIKVQTGVGAKNRIRRYHFEQTGFVKLVSASKIEVLHSFGYVGPVFSSCPHVVTIHDVNTCGHRESMPWGKRLLLGSMLKLVARRAEHIITVSEFSKNEINQHLRVADHRISAIHEDVRDHFDGVAGRQDIQIQYGLRGPYLIAMSSQWHHKNILRLLAAFASIAEQLPHNLVLMGHLPEGGDIDNCIRRFNLRQRVISTGYVPRDHVLPLIAKADLFVFPSLYEGFGLPLLEAQKVGTCVACSQVASLPEVAGEGAFFFNPYSVAEIAEALVKLLSDEGRRKSLVLKGYENILRFSWLESARQTLGVYRRLAGREPAVRNGGVTP